MTALIRLIVSCLLLLAACTGAIAQSIPSNAAINSKVIGTQPQLIAGVAAMQRGAWQEGIELTQAGLEATVSVADRASALANLCAAHAALKRYPEGLNYCNESIALQENKWQTWQNRAACHLGIGKIDEALGDLQRGLALNPDADSLQKTLAILREREKRQQERLRSLVES